MSRQGTTFRAAGLPTAPLLDWSSFSHGARGAGVHSIDDLGNSCVTTSGRAAIYQALLQLRLEPGSVVLVPTYHCPTMVAPVLIARLEVGYFGIREDGLPNLETIDPALAGRAKAMLVSHYFGLAHSLTEVRQWCDEHQIALIEDCAHCYFGDAGDRPVGTWGDYATASLSKFFPVPEGGVLASARKPLLSLQLSPQGFHSQVKAWADVLERAVMYERLRGINTLLAGLFRVKNALSGTRDPNPVSHGATASAAELMMRSCNMERIAMAPAWTARVLRRLLPRGHIIDRRRRNFAIYREHFSGTCGAHQLFESPDDAAVPYVFPLWVDDADRVYHALRAQGLPVFRWDRIWPGTPAIRGDLAPSWSKHVLQLLCHQDLGEDDVARTARATLDLLARPADLTAAPRDHDQSTT
ncbi:DegT/DnrJ/EryC1/StrS family aminotransferase [Accumulibacter sp.]|uniref:DegT/DnrJ/EryC1/StrS family aminotransferase n=1 Tax=Accumulibacter sp. TaxID=2053492 RepID=UPI0025EDDF96|nr:DegT/DnrJ/EryC1/StrS family aminotransferase [Accumulibacter sp.]MCM8596880.1 DegT/DnrJ/EryC1/StrS family aminotransferase [Accumulibacter sp.]MCM8624586.1 DegT/DnrJ/EryC1/StrS family aminotransferase [Accumulibacter sp.]MDS4051028.1 DegT/DnrJ/EryC1/StrS family aminotransferase [Accumulibacter sp.]